MTPAIRLIIAGSRTVDPSDDDITAAANDLVVDVYGARLGDAAEHGWTRYILEVICGRAISGADPAGERWARAREIPVHPEPVTEEDRARWGPYLAPKYRNRRMAERGTHALIWWDGLSSGSADMAMRMVMRGKPVVGIPARAVRPPPQRPRRRPASR